MNKTFEVPKSTNAGIYMLYNLTKNKIYIGETKNFHNRSLQHREMLQSNTHSNKEMQEDYNNNCEFAFVILEDVGKTIEKDKLVWREKEYILAFRKKRIELYNCETTKQIIDKYIYDTLRPTLDKIYSDFREKTGCELRILKCCSENRLKTKFEKMNNEEQIA